MNRDLLEKPFDKSLVKSRKGAFGRVQYVEGAEYVRRLNQAFEADWSFEIVGRQILDAEVLVHGKLTAGGIVKHAFGGSSITRAKETGEVVSIVNDLKAAATDSLKKACSLLGIGLHLYSDAQPAAGERHPRTSAQQRRTSPGNGGNGGDPDRLSQRALSSIWSLGRRLGLTADQIRQRTVQNFSVAPEFLSKRDAATFLTQLSEQIGGGVQ